MVSDEYINTLITDASELIESSKIGELKCLPVNAVRALDMARELIALREVAEAAKEFMDDYGDDPYTGENIVLDDNTLKIALENYEKLRGKASSATS